MNAKVFEQVNAELVRVNSVEDARLYAFYFDEESGNLDNVHLNGGIHALAEQCGAEVTVKDVAGYGQYQFRVGDVLYSQSIPEGRTTDAARHCERPEWAKKRDYPQWDCPADNPGCYAPACQDCEWWKEDEGE